MEIVNATALEELKKEEMNEIRGGWWLWAPIVMSAVLVDREAQNACQCSSIFSRYGLAL